MIKSLSYIAFGLLLILSIISCFAAFWAWIFVGLAGVFSSTYFTVMLSITIKLTVFGIIGAITGFAGTSALDE